MDAPAAPVAIAPPRCADKEACHHEAEDREADADFVAAASAYGRACDFGDPASCFAQGLVLRGRIQPPDDNGSHDAFVKACELGIADGCAQAGTDLITGIGVDEDVAKGRAMLDRACTAGSGLSCYNVAVSTRDGTFGATKDTKAAFALFEKGCTVGFAAACTEQAMALYDGIGATKDRAKATTIATRACEAKAVQCYFLAELQQKAKKLPEARALYDKACGAGSAVACHNIGVMLEKGIGGAKDETRSNDAYQKACSLGISDDCSERRSKECATGFEDACKQPARRR
jgi:TPR repeat protein